MESMKVLVVDDDIVDREHIKRLLRRTDTLVEVTEAETVDEGLQAISQSDFDVVLLDYNMPRRNGIELLIELKEDSAFRKCAVVMVSTSDDEKLALDCIRAGASDFLMKTDVSSFRLRRAMLAARARAELERQLYDSYRKAKRLAEEDSLTGLSNRLYFEESLKLCITNINRSDDMLALLLIDLDNFKYINDNHGHNIGDQLLVKVASRIKYCLRGNELFARIGGDEFAILLTNLKDPNDANRVALRIINVLVKPFSFDGVSIKISSSIGISIHPRDGADSKELSKHADIAMYRAKHKGRNRVCFYEEEMQSQFLYQYEVETKLASALKMEEFSLNYQPVLDVARNRIVGVEALLRWRSGEEQFFPDVFIPIAEKSRLIIDIGKWVIDKSLSQLCEWNVDRREPIELAINLSPMQLADRDLVTYISDKLRQFEISPELVEFELTETSLLVNSEKTTKTIQGISDLGCRIALDDFGTGYSSLSHLNNYPIDTVKIDRSLMPCTSEKKHAEKLIEGMVFMIKKLGYQTVAEGVETKTDLDLCQRLDIDKVQGFYYDKPITASELGKKYLSLI